MPQQNEMLSLYFTAFGFISKNECSPKENIPNRVCIWKTWYYKKLLTIENNQFKCSDYSFLFSMRTDGNKQHFN